MTDIIKVLEEMDSGKAMNHLDAHPELLAESLRIFREEMKDLGNSRPIILAFGDRALPPGIQAPGRGEREYSLY